MSEMYLKEYRDLIKVHIRFLRHAISLYESTQLKEIEFEKIAEENWNAKTTSRILDLIEEIDEPIIFNSNRTLSITSWEEREGECFIEFSEELPTRIFRGKIGSSSSESKLYGQDKIEELRYTLNILYRLENTRTITTWHNELRKALVFESPNLAWDKSIQTQEDIIHPTPTNDWKKILRCVSSSEGSRLTVITGSASAGKTTILIEIIIQALLQNKRMLISGYNHSTVNYILKILAFQLNNKPSIREDSFILRLASEGTKEKVKGISREHLLINRLQKTLERCVNSIKHLEDPVTELGQVQQSWRALAKEILDNRFTKRSLPSPKDKRHEFEIWLINASNVVFSTTMSLPNQIKKGLKEIMPFDLVILDDANILNIPRALIGLELGKQWIIAGDMDQLAPNLDHNLEQAMIYGQNSLIGEYQSSVTISAAQKLLQRPVSEFRILKPEEAINYELKAQSEDSEVVSQRYLVRKSKESVLEALKAEGTYHEKALIDLFYNHRMNESLANVIYPSIYGREIETSPAVRQRNKKTNIDISKDNFRVKTPITILDTSLRAAAEEKFERKSYYNTTEAVICAQVLYIFLEHLEKSKNEQIKDILIITYYPGQQEEISKQIATLDQIRKTEDLGIFQHNQRTIRVQTISTSSNDEADIVIFSLTRSFRGNPCFLNDFGAITVGFTRVKSFFVLIGQYQNMIRVTNKARKLDKNKRERLYTLFTMLRDFTEKEGYYQLIRRG